MNVPNLSRRLAARIIEGLQGRGRIVVVRGGTSALVRSIDDAITTFVSPIFTRFEQDPSTIVDQQKRDSLEPLASEVARTLFSSEHLEDVFADLQVVEREVFDTALQLFSDASDEERAHVLQVELDTLGYIAATVGKLAAEDQVVVALERAADLLDVKLSSYEPELRQAFFELGTETFPDLRLELEEAVAEELAYLVTERVVQLPVIERTRPLVHHVSPAHRTRLTRLIDRVATRTLRSTGCSAHWELPDDRSVRVAVTPLSEQDARDVDTHVSEFVSELDVMLADVGAPLVTELAEAEAANASRHNGHGAEEEEAEAEPESAPEPVVAPKRAPRAGMRAKASSRAASKRAPAKRVAKRPETPAVEKPATRKKAAVKRATPAKKTRAVKKS